MNMSTSIGDIDIEHALSLRYKNYDFLNHVFTIFTIWLFWLNKSK